MNRFLWNFAAAIFQLHTYYVTMISSSPPPWQVGEMIGNPNQWFLANTAMSWTNDSSSPTKGDQSQLVANQGDQSQLAAVSLALGSGWSWRAWCVYFNLRKQCIAYAQHNSVEFSKDVSVWIHLLILGYLSLLCHQYFSFHSIIYKINTRTTTRMYTCRLYISVNFCPLK